MRRYSTGNLMIDEDDGKHHFSPKYKNKHDYNKILLNNCVMCGCLYDINDGGTDDACGKCMLDDDYLNQNK